MSRGMADLGENRAARSAARADPASDSEALPAPQPSAPKVQASAAPDDVDSIHRPVASDDLGRASESSSRVRVERIREGETSPATQSDALRPPLSAAAPSPGPIRRRASSGDRDRDGSRGPREPRFAQPQRAERPDQPPSSATSDDAAPAPEDLHAALSAAAFEGDTQQAAARAPASDSAQAEPRPAAGRKPSTTSREKPAVARGPEGSSPLPIAAGAAAAASPQPTKKDAASRAPTSERAAASASLRPSRAPTDEPRVEEPARKPRPPSPETPERRESSPAAPTSAAPLTPLTASPSTAPAAPARAIEAPPLPAPAAPLAAQAEADPSLHVGLLERAAHLSLNIDGAGDLALHVRVRDGNTEIRAEGPAAQLLKDRVHELSASLASEGLQLGHFDLPREQQRGQAEAPERPEPRQAPRASAPASGVSESAAPSGSGVHVRA
jgi:hypothetical protein